MEIIDEFKKQLEAVLTSLKKELAVLRGNRPSPALVEDIKVSYYNQILTVKQLGSISVIPPREINVQIWDKQAVGNVVKALETSGYGFSVQNEGNLVRIFLPELSEERRKELLKKAKQIVEEHRIRVRNLRDEANKQVQKSFEEHKFNEDQKFKLKESVQKEVEQFNNEIEKSLEKKIQEIMT